MKTLRDVTATATETAGRYPGDSARVRAVSLSCYSIRLPLTVEHYTMSGGRRLTEFQTTVVEVKADNGVAGYGEACTLGDNYIEGFAAGVQATVSRLAQTALACPILAPDVLESQMDRDVKGHLAGKAAIDTAFWDLRGKLLGQPIAVLLGGVHQPTYPLFYPLALAGAEEMADEAARASRDGYRRWQLKVGGDPMEDADRLRAVLKVVGDDAEFVTSDANGGWTMAQARFFLRACRDLADLPCFVEQPCPDLSQLGELREVSAWPMIADEGICDLRDIVRCVELKAADAVNIKPTRVGGLTKAARIRDLAQALGLLVVIDEPMGGDVATAAVSQLAASCRPERLLAASHLASFSGLRLVTSGGASVVKGRGEIPQGSGLGIEIDLAALGEAQFALSS